MLLIPMHYARHMRIGAELLPRKLGAERPEAESLGCIAYSKKRHPVARHMA